VRIIPPPRCDSKIIQYFLVFIVLFFASGLFSVHAQDLIILKDGNTIEAKVVEISPTEIRYRRFTNLDGPIIVIPADSVLSIRYENGTTDIINDNATPTPTAPAVNQFTPNPRLNTLGVTFGYQGVSQFGFTVNGTVSPGDYTFFDFNLGLGFMSFAFNARINFNAFVPFNNGGWYAGIGISGGYNESFEKKGVIAGNITTGFIFFNWLNIGYTLQVGNFDGYLNHNAIVGYAYRFKEQPVVEYETSAQNFIIRGTTLVKYRGNARNVTIPAGITSIGEKAFYENKNLISVIIPEGVTYIDSDAFEGCISLTNITIPASVTSIGNYALKGCTSLTSITIPEGVTTIGNWAFSGCTSLINITFADESQLHTIREESFANCTSLPSIIIPAGVWSIGVSAFETCRRLTTVTFEGSAITRANFGRNAFPQNNNIFSLGDGGNNLRTAYLAGGAGTYTRTAGGSDWAKQ